MHPHFALHYCTRVQLTVASEESVLLCTAASLQQLVREGLPPNCIHTTRNSKKQGVAGFEARPEN